MKRKYKVAHVIIILAAAVAIVAAVLIKKRAKECAECSLSGSLNLIADSKTATAQVSPTASSTPSPLDWRMYKSTEFGFQLTFSDVWEGYTVAKNSSPADTHAVTELDVTMPNKAIPLVLFVYDSGAYESSFAGTKLGQSSKYVFTYRTDDTLSSSSSTITEKEIADRLTTFQLTK